MLFSKETETPNDVLCSWVAFDEYLTDLQMGKILSISKAV